MTDTHRPNRAKMLLGVNLKIIASIFLARIIIDANTRMLTTFLPQFSDGLNVSVVVFSWFLSFRSIVGVISPIFGVWSDRYGRRKMMTIALIGQGIALLGMVFNSGIIASIWMALSGLCTIAFIPAAQAYVSDQARPNLRGRAVGMIETAWSLSSIIGMPIIGWLIFNFGWQMPLFVLSIFTFIGSGIIWWILPATPIRKTGNSLDWKTTRKILGKSNVRAVIGVALFIFMAESGFLTLWGIWFPTDFQFDTSKMAWVATGLGIAELGGVGLSSLFIDRIGKRRGSLWSIFLWAMVFIILSFTQHSPSLAVAGVVAMGVLSEFSIVSLIALYADQVPSARGTVLSLSFLGISIGAALGAPMISILFTQYGVVAATGAISIALLSAFVLAKQFLID